MSGLIRTAEYRELVSDTFLISSAAEQDYAEALSWYADRDIRAAENFDAELDRAIQSIAEHPGRFPSCDKRHHVYLMRRFPVS
jgi:plasmid stabilization system protein ParE